MIDHNLPQFELKEHDNGTMLIPSENGNLKIAATLRQFLVHSRQYRPSFLRELAHTDGLNVRENDNADSDAQNDATPFFFLQIIAKPRANFLSSSANITDTRDAVSQVLESLAGQSQVRYNRGNRAAWVAQGEFENHDEYGDIVKFNMLIGTSVFYNDYRVTLNFPGNDMEVENVVEEIYEQLVRNFSDLNFAVTEYQLLKKTPTPDLLTRHF